MDEEANSWIRTKFSHTVYHRLDASRLSLVPFNVQPIRISGRVKSTLEPAAENPKLEPNTVQIQQHPTLNEPRARNKVLSFREASSNQNRFSTPHPRRKENETRLAGNLFRKDPHETKSPTSNSPRNHSPLRHFTSLKCHDKSASCKKLVWTKYFDHGGGRVTSVDAADEHMIDLSKLFLGLRFAHGAHSQLYHGIYMDEPVVVKIIRVPDDDENVVLGARLENQFSREVTLLSLLHHQNIIKNLRPTIPSGCPPTMKALFEQCWSLQPGKRPEFWQIVKVLEKLESSLARDGTLDLVQNPTCHDHKKGLVHWIQKLGPTHHTIHA